MAAQVNKKFVIILSAFIGLLVVAATGAGLYAIKNNGARHASRGDKLEAQGNFEDAYQAYGRAVAKDQTNVPWLTKYRDLARQTVPKTREELEKRYRLYLGTLRNLSIAQPNDPEPLLAFLSERHERMDRAGWQADATKEFIDECVSMSRTFRQTEPDSEAIGEIDWYLAQARLELARRAQISEQERIENREALEEIVRENPDHVEAKIYLAMWHLDEADRHASNSLRQLEEQERAVSDRLFSEIIAEHPDHLLARIMDLARQQVAIARTTTEPAARRRAIEALRPKAEETLAVFNAMDPEQLDLRVLEACRMMLPRIMGKEASERMLPMAERVYQKQQSQAWIALTYARILMDAERFDDAVIVLDGVLAQQKLPVSLEATMQPAAQISAFAERVDAALFAAERADNRQEWIERADRYMGEFEQAASADDQASVKLRRAKVAMMKENFAGAIRDLSDLEDIGMAEFADVKYMLAVSLHKQGNFGGAREKLQSLVDDGNITLPTMSLLADSQVRLNDFEGAEATLERAIEIFPQAADSFRSRLDTVKAALGESNTLDPVTKALLDSRQARQKGDNATARAAIAGAMADNPDNDRLIDEMIQIELAENNRDAAKALITRALAKWPDNEQFQRYEIFARVENENEAMLEWIEKSEGTDLEKALRRYSVYSRMGDRAEAERQLALAEQADPENAVVINERFSQALLAEDFETARRYATKAAQLNLDQLDGALFQGRLELARGQYAAAVATFDSATKRIPHSPGAWSLLGDAQIASAQIDAAVDSYTRAMRLRPGDPDIARRYARALLRVGRGPEALTVLDDVMRINPQRGEIFDLWIELQGAYGDQDAALAERARLFERDPANTQNAVAYYALLLETQDWQQAASVLERIRQDPNLKRVTLVDMEAKLLAARGDAMAGRRVYEEYVNSLGDAAESRDLIAYGSYLDRYNMGDTALEVYRRAQKAQKADEFDADIALANALINRANALGTRAEVMESSGQAAQAEPLVQQRASMLKDAADAMRHVLDGGGERPDAGQPVRRSLASVLVDLERYPEAEKVIAQIAEEAPKKQEDLQVMLLRARVAAQQDNLREARRLLDLAAEKNPGSFEPYWERARLNRDDPALASSVVRDLQKVTQLRPGMTEAWGMWFDLYRAQGRVADALAALRTGVQQNPGVRDLRQFLVYQLVDMNRFAEAQEVAVDGTRQKTDREFWLQTSGDLYGQSGLWQQALPMYEALYGADDSIFNAVSYLDAVLRQATPNRGTVQQLLQALPRDEELDLRTVMVASRARAFFKQRERSQQLSKRGFELAGSDWRSMAYWLGQATLAEGSVDAALQLAESFKPSLEATIPLLILGGNQLMAAGAKPENVLSRLSALDSAELDEVSKFELLRLKAKLYYLDGPLQDYEKSASLNQQALEINPNALDVANDLAYTLAEDLGRPAEGLPFAERAANLAPNNPTVLDTLGWVYHALGRDKEAAATLERAVTRAQGRDNSDEFIAIVHLGVVRAALGDERAAQDLLTRAETLLRLDPSIKNYYPTAIEELRRAVN